VENTLANRTELLKERCIGEDVFGRAGYEPSEQNLVRVTANELRKRLAACYTGQPEGIRIELPRGSYIPLIHFPPDVAAPGPTPALPAPPESVATSRRRRLLRWSALPILVAACAASAYFWWPRSSPEEAFWQPVLAAGKPAVIWNTGWGAVMPGQVRQEFIAHQEANVPFTVKLLPNDVIPVNQMTAYGHVYGIAAIMSWLAAHHHPAQLRLGNWLTPSDVHDAPVIYFGARNNPWTTAMNRDLRFEIQPDPNGGVVVDKTDPNRRWAIPEYRKLGYDVTTDYGVITRLIDRPSGQVRISIGGICHYSSQAGAEFLTSPKYWTEIERVAPKGWQRMNIQVVLEMRVVENGPQSPKIVGWHFW
jgi:hypothetical protein